jgi:hypothetical protein
MDDNLQWNQGSVEILLGLGFVCRWLAQDLQAQTINDKSFAAPGVERLSLMAVWNPVNGMPPQHRRFS